MKQQRFSRGGGNQGQTRNAGKPRSQQPKIFQLSGVRSGDPMVEPPLHPNRKGQRSVIVASVQRTIKGPGVAHVTLADNPLGRSYPISASHLPEEALIPFQQRP